MIIKVLIPQAFENMEEATIGKWLKTEGEAVGINDALCELITEKTTFDLPAEDVPQDAPVGGVLLRRIIATEKSIVPVGYCIALLGEANDELPDVESEVARENAAVVARHQSASTAGSESTPSLQVSSLQVPSLQVPSLQTSESASTPVAAASRIRATPAARRAARERGVAIEDVAAAFPGKVLTEDDVANFQPPI
jgi:pyruvate dehydrogenase E2 component (dihydrolipoamide acetyltransferase)